VKTYRVTWEIDVEADSPQKAAEEALRIQRDPNSIATFFKIVARDDIVLVDVDLG
jgi:hypothetical protein